MGRNILVIEDNEKHRFFFEDILHDSGYNVYTASDGNESRKKMGSGTTFDLILVDIAVPEFDAIEFIKEFKDKYQILVVSAYTEEVKGKELLPDERLIKKPFDTNELLKQVREILK
jgi:DNA-binding response OmpR family regulator